MLISDWLSSSQVMLANSGIATARLEALVLLEDALGVDRTRLLAHPDMEVPKDAQNVLKGQLTRRAGHEPLAYVRGRVEFYGREFVVTPDVLVPRPESETMIELLKAEGSRSNDQGLRIIDVGTGCGALAITAKLELPDAEVLGVDVDPKCLEVARQNAILNDVKITLAESDLLTLPNSKFQIRDSILLCNLPYVPDAHTVNSAAMQEPAIAIFGGPDGLDVYRKLFKQIDSLKNRPLLILTESLPPQHPALKSLAEHHGYQQETEDDFIQLLRRV